MSGENSGGGAKSGHGKKAYRETLNLPKTAFPMKANLVRLEPELRKRWADTDIYGLIRRARRGRPLYILHDGPPYANGDIHMGHVINKVLKDFVVKYKTMAGFDAPFVPGWDCHGLPIESKVTVELGSAASSKSKLDIRQTCMKYAARYVKIQSEQFQQLAVFGDFDNPYLTFKPEYEAGILEVFAELVEKGLVHKQLKPIHWSISCRTALAEAELEYNDVSSPSIFVNFPATAESATRLTELGLVETGDTRRNVYFMIWTTTPWTLAANLAVAVHPHLEYTSIKVTQNGRTYTSIVAAERAAAVAAAGLENGRYELSEARVKGRDLENLRYNHPFVKENPTAADAYMVICADYVTTEDGTGIVHIAPGHGLEDYASGLKYGLEIYSPVKDDGCYDDTVPPHLRGMNVFDADAAVCDDLRGKNLLFAKGRLVHSYPHCWRSKDPVIFRATEQWFISMDRELPGGKNLRRLALERTGKITWIPAWGQKRIEGMLESRPDWCISRQRSWGLAIPVFINSEGRTLLTKKSVLAVARHVAKRGSNSWFTDPPRRILGDGFELPEGFTFEDLKKEQNIFDVWFESGCSWHSVAEKTGWPLPVDLYLEGSDQHRGWFQLSLLPALAATGKAPFKNVLTHGFTVDEKGLKQSKSLGNYVNAQEEVGKYGADILRLWVCGVNYREDIRCSDELIGRTQDAYRKIRNTLRYLLGNLDDFDPGLHAVEAADMLQIDRWALQQLHELIGKVKTAYERFVFHRVFSLIYNFCTVQMSSIYMDVLKDRLYCSAAGGLARRSAQTAMHRILGSLLRLMAPILAYTAEEAWAAMKFKPQNVESVHLAEMPQPPGPFLDKNEIKTWERIMDLRSEVLNVLEDLRRRQAIASNLEASVTVESGDGELLAALDRFGTEEFAALCIASEVKLVTAAGETKITAAKSPHKKCARCWNLRSTVGSDSEYDDVCSRCAEVLRSG